MADEFKYLFTPFKIGSMTVRNRIVVSGHETFLGENNLMSKRHAIYLAERAKGGVGLIVTEAQAVHRTSTGGFNRVCLAYEKESIPRNKLVADMVHDHGARILGQLYHCGHHTESGVLEWQPIWAPSAIPCVRFRETPKEMEQEDIEAVIRGFVDSALNLQEGGFDGVELHGGHSYLISQFWSPLINRRTDQYSFDPWENRMRFAFEVVDAVRSAVGRDFVVGMRISGDELTPGGLNPEDTAKITVALEEHGGLDYLSVSAGTYHTSFLVPPMAVPLGANVPAAATIREAVNDIPLFVVGRINDPTLAEKILADGHADMVCMTRANICDPEMANKAREGRLDDIRACVACNQGCLAKLRRQRAITCIQNPAVGREDLLGIGTLGQSAARKKVAVIGGGPAGMKAAEIAARRGHQVFLYEKDQALGGQVNLAAKGVGREEFANVTGYLIRQLPKLGVKVLLGVQATADSILAASYDAVVVATGSTPLRTGFTELRPTEPGIPGADQDNVLTTWDVLKYGRETGPNVVVVDDDGQYKGATVIDSLVSQGKKVEVITRLPVIGMELQDYYDYPFWYSRILKAGVVGSPNTSVRIIDGNCIVVYNIYTGRDRRIEGVDSVVLITGDRANDDLYKELKGKVGELHRVGDCVSPRRVVNAIWEGEQVGRAL